MKSTVIKNDLKNLKNNKFLLVSIIAITLIPLIYGGLYLAAFWEPYEHTEDIKVGVVNLDEGFTNDENKLIEHGKSIETNLKHNDSLGWCFESNYNTALEKLENNMYYSIYVIPKDFSRKLEGLKNGNLNKPIIKFIPNEKKNYINGLITKKGADTIKAQINATVSEVFANTIIDKLHLMKDGLNTGSEALFMLSEGTHELKNKVILLSSGTELLNKGTEMLNEKLIDASNGSTELDEATKSLSEKIPDLIDGIEDLDKGSILISSKTAVASDGVKDLKSALDSYQSKLPELEDATKGLYNASDKLASSTNSLTEKSEDLEDALNTVSEAMNSLKSGLNMASDNSLSIVNLASDISRDANKLAKAEEANLNKTLGLSSNAPMPTQTEITQLITTISSPPFSKPTLGGKLQSHFVTLSEMGVLSNEATNLISDANKVKIDINNSNGETIAKNELNTILAINLKDKLTELSLKSGELFLPNNSIDDFTAAKTILEGTDFEPSLTNMVTVLNNIYSGLPKTADEQQAKSTFIESEIESYGDVLSKKLKAQALFDANLALASGLDDGSDGASELNRGIEKVNKSIPKFASSLNVIYKNNNYLSSNLKILNTKIPTLEQGISVISDNVNDLSLGMSKLENATITLSEGTSELSEKTPDLETGISMISDGSNKISNGLLKLSEASAKLDDGMSVINSKMPEFLDGVNQLNDVSVTVADKLEDGASQLSDIVTMNSQEMGNFMAEPVKLETDELYNIETYGPGFTPYFVSLALWVGALALFIVIPIENKTNASPQRFAIGRYFMYMIVGLIQAVLLSLIILKLGLTPSNVKAFVLFNIFLSWTFIAVVQTLIFLLGDVGKLISTIWFVLQLTASGGTFAKELTPKFFQVISPFMPFTYAVSATKEIISGINTSIFKNDILVLLGIQIVSLIILFIGSKYKTYKKDDKTHKNIEGTQLEEIIA